MADSPAQTLAFAEGQNFKEGKGNFPSFLSYHPEMMCTLGTDIVSASGGDLYTHDSNIYNQFYGVDYPSTITVVFNQNAVIKKSFVALTQGSNVIWECPEIETQVMSYGSTPQQSNLVAEDFEDEEGQFNAALLMDSNSVDGIINGDSLKGKWIKVKFSVTDASSLIIFDYVELHSLESALNVK